MPVVHCPKCRKSLKVSPQAAGRRGACPHCKSTFSVPGVAVAKPVAMPVKRSRMPWIIGGAVGVVLLGLGIILGAWMFRPAPPPKTEPIASVNDKPEPPKKTPPKVDPKIEPVDPPVVVEKDIDLKLDEEMAALLTRLNEFRERSKLSKVTLDSVLSRGCQDHAEYLAKNADRLAKIAIVDEEPANPGFSDAGQKAAQASLIEMATPTKSLASWIGRMISRPELLAPDLEVVGVGAAKLAKAKWVTVLDAKRGRGSRAVVFPGPGQTGVPLSFSGGPESIQLEAGFPVSLQFAQNQSVTKVEARLTDELGNRIPAEVSTPDKPLPGVTRPAFIGLLPKALLAPKSVYKVHIAGLVDDRPFANDWSFTTEDDGDEDGVWAKKTLDRVNRARASAGLKPVTLDDELSRGCRLHAKYLVKNARREETKSLGAHGENEKLPGYTPEGDKSGKASNISIGDFEPIDACDGWLATLYHRVPILDPPLQKVGFGCARGAGLGWVTVFNVATGRDNSDRPAPILFPADGQADVPLTFPPGGEIPNPIPNDKTGLAGFPITVVFPFRSTLKAVTGSLEDAKGKPVECWFSSPESPANPKFPQGMTVCLIPKTVLQPDQIYRATVAGQLNEQPWKKTWSFTTAKSAGGDPVTRVLDRFNAARRAAGVAPVEIDAPLSKGCQAHADYIVRNSNKLNGKEFSLFDENPLLTGFSADGQQAAKRSTIFLFAPHPTFQVDDLVGSLQRRSFVLDPKLRRISFGCTNDVGRGWTSVLDVNTGRVGDDPIVSPAPDETDVPRAGFDHAPTDKTVKLGYPIVVFFPGNPSLNNVKAALTNGEGKVVDAILSTPARPLYTNVAQFGYAGLHPRQPLVTGQVYEVNVSLEVDGMPWQKTWKFTCGE